MRKPKAYDPDAPIAEEGETEENQDQDQKKKQFQWSPKHRSGYTKQERLA